MTHPVDDKINAIADGIVDAFLADHDTCPDCGGWTDAAPGPFDPRDFTLAELGLLSTSLKKTAQHQLWRADRPGIPAERARELREAAERRLRLNFKLIRARKFIQALTKEEAAV